MAGCVTATPPGPSRQQACSLLLQRRERRWSGGAALFWPQTLDPRERACTDTEGPSSFPLIPPLSPCSLCAGQTHYCTQYSADGLSCVGPAEEQCIIMGEEGPPLSRCFLNMVPLLARICFAPGPALAPPGARSARARSARARSLIAPTGPTPSCCR